MNKKIKLFVLLILGMCVLIILLNAFNGKEDKEESNSEQENNAIQEYIPLEEITEEQERQTTITLYYKNKKTGKIDLETRRIDSKKLLEEPYKFLVELLISTPENKELESCIPKDTEVISANLQANTVNLNLSKEFIEKHSGTEEEEKKTISSIVNTLTELNEVEYIKILIDGKENQAFNDNKVNFKDKFCRETR